MNEQPDNFHGAPIISQHWVEFSTPDLAQLFVRRACSLLPATRHSAAFYRDNRTVSVICENDASNQLVTSIIHELRGDFLFV